MVGGALLAMRVPWAVRALALDIACLEAVGIDPMSKRFLMLKSRVHWRAGLKRLAYAVVECAGTGVCTSDYAALGLHKVRRPIYPIDAL